MTDDRDLKEALNAIDRIIGKQYRGLAIGEDKANDMLKLSGHCRICKFEIKAEASRLEPRYGTKLVQTLLAGAELHMSKHKIVIATH